MVTTELNPVLLRVGRRVKASRLARGLTARQTAERAQLSVRFYSLLEGGKANIAVGRLDRVASALGVSLAELVADESGANGQQLAISLLGLRGAGKSTIGPLLADRLHIDFHELDERIEESAGLSVSEIFDLHGEPYYRRLESRCLSDLVQAGSPCVIALSGGIVGNADAFDIVQRRTTSIWLRAEPEEHMERVHRQGDHRPMADRPDAMAELRAILASREPLYGQADLSVATSGRRPAAVLADAAAGVQRAGWPPAD